MMIRGVTKREDGFVFNGKYKKTKKYGLRPEFSSPEAFKKLKERLIQKKIKFIDPPYIRFKGEEIEQETMFIEDPYGNAMEIKTMKNPNTLFKKVQ